MLLAELLKERQKLIRIADRSEQGWKTAEQYKKDPVGRIVTRIRKAEAAAEKKAVKKRQKRQRQRPFRRYVPYSGPRNIPVAGGGGAAAAHSPSQGFGSNRGRVSDMAQSHTCRKIDTWHEQDLQEQDHLPASKLGDERELLTYNELARNVYKMGLTWRYKVRIHYSPVQLKSLSRL